MLPNLINLKQSQPNYLQRGLYGMILYNIFYIQNHGTSGKVFVYTHNYIIISIYIFTFYQYLKNLTKQLHHSFSCTQIYKTYNKHTTVQTYKSHDNFQF